MNVPLKGGFPVLVNIPRVGRNEDGLTWCEEVGSHLAKGDPYFQFAFLSSLQASGNIPRNWNSKEYGAACKPFINVIIDEYYSGNVP